MADNILPSGDSVYRGTLQSLKPYRAMNIFSSDTHGNDPALVEATKDFYKSHAKLTSKLLEDGLTPVGLPRSVRAEDLGESLAVVPTKYGVSAVVPVGTTNAFFDPENDAIVVNTRIIYGTMEQKESTGIYKRALAFVDKHAPEWVKNKLKPFYRSKLETLENETRSREKLTETSAHELFHRKQKRAGIMDYLLGKYGNVTDYVRNVVERHAIRYTSRLFNRRTGEGTYGVLEDQAIENERKTGMGPHHILRKSELHGPDEAGRLAEDVYGLKQQFEF
jgi:hypothetical protein